MNVWTILKDYATTGNYLALKNILKIFDILNIIKFYYL